MTRPALNIEPRGASDNLATTAPLPISLPKIGVSDFWTEMP